MGSFGTGNPFTEDFRLLRGIPATLNGTTVIASNNILVTASRKDPWIRAASTNGSATTAMTPAFIRGGAADKIIAFDFFLCSGNGEAVPLDVVELIFADQTTVVQTTVSAGSVVLEECIASGVLAENAAMFQIGRRVFMRANSVGRVTGTVAMLDATDLTVIVKYRHITTSLVTTVVAT